MATPQQFIAALKKYVGVPYLWGGKTSKGLDCSGLIALALADVGVRFVHGSANQINATTQITVDQAWRTPGALLYRPGHDAISLGDGTCLEAIRPRVQITKRTATYQGKPRFTRAGIIPSIHKVSGVNVSKMVSPAEGRFTSGYGKRKLSLAPFHAGVDIAPPVPGTIGEPVVAAFAGVVEKAGWGIVKYRSGNGVLIRNPDGERQYYGHLNKIRVKVGQSVKAGDRIGDMGATGKVTGAHLHFETWRNSSQSSHYDPKLAFDKHGVTIGSKPNVSGGATPAPDPTPTKDWFDMATQKELESALWNVLNRDITVGGSTGKRYKGGTAPLYSLIRDGAYALDAAQDIPRQVMMYDISVGGSTKKAIGKDSTTAAALLRYAAAAVYDGRNQHAQSTARQDALQAAVAELARERGVDAKVITAAIDKAVAAAISELGATLDAEV